MKILIAEDDFTSRILIEELLKKHGSVHSCINGDDAYMAFKKSLEDEEAFDLICLDIMMPKMDGQEALIKIRELEDSKKVEIGSKTKIIMTTALGDLKSVSTAFYQLCDSYIQKPIDRAKLENELEKLKLI